MIGGAGSNADLRPSNHTGPVVASAAGHPVAHHHSPTVCFRISTSAGTEKVRGHLRSIITGKPCFHVFSVIGHSGSCIICIILTRRRISINRGALGSCGHVDDLAMDTPGDAAAQTSGRIVGNDGVVNGRLAGVHHEDTAAAQVSCGVAFISGDENIPALGVDFAIPLDPDAAAFGVFGGVIGDAAAGHGKRGRTGVHSTPDADAAAGAFRGVAGDGAAGHFQFNVITKTADDGDTAAARRAGFTVEHSITGRRVVGDGTAGDGNGAVAGGVDAAALRRRVVGDGTAGHIESAVRDVDRAAISSGGVAGEGAALEVQSASNDCDDRLFIISTLNFSVPICILNYKDSVGFDAEYRSQSPISNTFGKYTTVQVNGNR